jgi:hypothetical protein
MVSPGFTDIQTASKQLMSFCNISLHPKNLTANGGVTFSSENSNFTPYFAMVSFKKEQFSMYFDKQEITYGPLEMVLENQTKAYG